MSRSIKPIHIALTVIAWGIFVWSLIRLAVVWGSLPDNIGVHFDENGEFDVLDSKKYAAYPYLISAASLVFCEITALLMKKVKLGMQINEKGEEIIRTALMLLLDISKLGLSFFFTGVWADCVIRQRPLDTNIPSAVMLIILFSFFVFVIALIAVKSKYKDG